MVYQEDRQGSLLYACWSCKVHGFQMLAQYRRQPQALHTCTDSQPNMKHACLQVDTSLQSASGPSLTVAYKARRMLATPPILIVAQCECDGDLSCHLTLLAPQVSAALLAAANEGCSLRSFARSQAEDRKEQP